MIHYYNPKYTGNEWLTIGGRGFTPNAVGAISLAFCPCGRPYLAYQDDGNFWKATVMKFDYPAKIINQTELIVFVSKPSFNNIHA